MNWRSEPIPVVTGVGVVSPAGIDCDSLWQALLTGTSGVGPVRSFDTSSYATHVGAEIDDERFVPRRGGPGRSALLAAEAGRQALEQAGLCGSRRRAVGLSIGTTMGESCWLEGWTRAQVVAGPTEVPAEELLRSGPDRLGHDTAGLLGLGGPLAVLAGACAAGNYALGHAADLIRWRRADHVLAGGADAFSRTAFTGFARLGALASDTCRPFSADRDGIVLGEGAGMLLVESLAAARSRGARVLAEVAGFGLAADAHHIVSPEPAGRGLVRAVAAALADACLEPEQIDYVCAHGTGTPANDRAEIAAVRSLFGNGRTPPLSSIKALTGHGLGAASAIEAVACVLALDRQIAPPTWNFCAPDPECEWDVIPNAPRSALLLRVLNCASAFGGNNAAVALRHAEAVEGR